MDHPLMDVDLRVGIYVIDVLNALRHYLLKAIERHVNDLGGDLYLNKSFPTIF
jgi:hypothetical protein